LQWRDAYWTAISTISQLSKLNQMKQDETGLRTDPFWKCHVRSDPFLTDICVKSTEYYNSNKYQGNSLRSNQNRN
jgi:hypothetical protein